ncbi:hypothetical protein M0811_09192 [Anaeramoeba ignava]|uniref:Uncharacterized protein n=1 Tax=Anaeramoeba ignava TaxID=1746090 RepID=A0A9Q0LHP4_ANAIG|nr:hypothetical protein M0811_09192 [Anaeramoeba ignava]
MRYQLRSWWLTPILAEVVAEVIGLSVVAGFFWTKGTDWFHKYYITILGYYVVASITLGHYFKTNGKPNIHGFFRHVIAILCGIEFYYLHEDLYLHWFGIDPKLLQAAHFLWIVFGFFFASFDDTFFWGFLSKWMKFNWIKAIFWLLVVWLFWYIFFYTPLVSDAKGTFQSEKFNQTLAVMQVNIK